MGQTQTRIIIFWGEIVWVFFGFFCIVFMFPIVFKLGLRPPGLEFRVLCLEGSLISPTL